MNDPDSIARSLGLLYRRTRHGIRPGLDRIRALLDRLDHPERAFPAVHVAGTNGKGSVCAMIESVLRAAGLRTGLYTSPHLVRFHERVRVAGRPIRDPELAALLEQVEAAAGALEREGTTEPATFFEMTTALAFEHFRREQVGIAVIETGMGGRWDATNVVVPLVSVICEIDVDHAEYLGRTVAEIAAEKAGIVKRGRPVVCGATHPEAESVVRRTAAELDAPYRAVASTATVRRLAQDSGGQRIKIETENGSWPPLRLPLIGAHQLANVAIAVAALEEVFGAAGIEAPPKAMVRGLETVGWPARLQRLQEDPPVLLDGAHNPHGARALAAALGEVSGGRRIGLIAGMLSDKDVAGFLREVAGVAARCWTVTPENERALPAGRLAEAARQAGLTAEPAASFDAAWDGAVAWARREQGIVCIAGSLYLAGEALRRRAGGERLFETDG